MSLEDKALDAAMMIVGDMGRPDQDYYEAKEGYLKGYKQALKDFMQQAKNKAAKAEIGDWVLIEELVKIAEDLGK